MGEEMAICIYCGRGFDPRDAKPEHIILAALGGKRKSKRIVCSECNGILGSNIDRPFAESTEFARVMMGIPRNAPISSSFTGANTGNKYRLSPDGQVTLKDTDVVRTPLDEGTGERVRVRADLHRAREIVNGLSRRYGPLQIGEICKTTFREPLEQIFQLTPEACRCVAKMALNFVAIAPGLGFDIALTESFDEIRRYVLNGDAFVELPSMIDRRDHFRLNRIQGKQCFNRIVVCCSAESKNAVAAVTILGALRFRVLLSRKYTGRSASAMIVNYPLERGAGVVTTEEFTPIATSELLRRVTDEEMWHDLETSVKDLLALAHRYQRERWMLTTIQEAFEEVAPSGITAENAESFAEYLAEAIVKGFLPPDVQLKRRYSNLQDLDKE